MALTAYCKKCNREVAPGEICPRCGTKLAKSATHAAWVLERNPAADWMSWNAVMRWLLPAGLAVLLLALILEGISGGTAAMEALFLGDFPKVLLALLGGLLILILAAFLMQGKELMDYVVDSRGVHVTRYLPNPTPLKLLTRLKSPAMMRQVDPGAEMPILRLDSRELSWRNVERVQLWPEKCYILFYAPSWWLRVPVRCTPFSWEDALFYVRDKLGKKKAVELPEHLRTVAPKKAPARRGAAAKPAPRAASAPAEATEKMLRTEASRTEAPRTETPAADADLPWEDSPAEAVSAEAGEQMAMDLAPDEPDSDQINGGISE